MDYDNVIDLQRREDASQQKYTYYLMTAAAASIALCVSQTQETVMSWSLSPLGLAVVCWAVSFGLGCVERKQRTMILGMTAHILFRDITGSCVLERDIKAAYPLG